MKKERLCSLDVLRGLDMMLLTVFQPLVCAFNRSWKLPDWVMYQCEHPWGGFTVYDIIMPLFIFMCGAAVPLALKRRLDAEGRPTASFFKHIGWRFVYLWVLGMLCQGRIITLDPHQICYYTNTLQTIAAGYVIAAFALFIKNAKVRFALPFVLVTVYSLLLAFGGDYSKQGNFAMKFERPIIDFLQYGKHDTNQYTWYLTTLMFGAMTLFGAQATEILVAAREAKRKFLTLAAYGAGLLALGWTLAIWIPMIKQIFTASFTLQAMGWSMLLLAGLYYLTDIVKFRKGIGLICCFGRNALFVYMFANLFGFAAKEFGKWSTQGLHLYLGEKPVPFIAGIVAAAIVCLVAVARDRLRTLSALERAAAAKAQA